MTGMGADDAMATASDRPRWFVRLGFIRMLAAIGFVTVSLFLGDLLDTGNPIGYIAGASAFLPATFALGAVLAGRSADARCAWLLGPGSGALGVFWSGVFLGALGFIVLFGVVLFGDSDYFFSHGGFGGLFMTVAGGLLVLLAASAVLRVVTRVVVLISKLVSRRPDVTLPPRARVWDSTEAGLLLVACLYCTAGVIAGLSGNPTVSVLDSSGNRIEVGDVTRSFSSSGDQEILTGFAPVLNIMLDEGRPPQRVDDYLAESTVLSLDGDVVLEGPSLADLDGVSCGDQPEPCLVVNNPSCPDSPACEPLELADTLPSGVGVDEDVVGYGRVLRRSTDDINWDASPFGEDLTMIAQWWLFAPYDGWTAPVGWTSAEVVKQHAGDWEAVVMGFSDERPLFVAGTSHCGGTWRDFHEVRVDNFGYAPADPFGQLLHPSLGHAKGSHAIYFDSYRNRSPDSLGCTKESRSDLFRIGAYALNMRDETSAALPVLVTPISGPEAEAVLEFPAYWGIENDVHLSTPFRTFGRPTGTVAHPAGPSSPSTKLLYQEPVTTVFCAASWHHDGAGSVGRADCP